MKNLVLLQLALLIISTQLMAGNEFKAFGITYNPVSGLIDEHAIQLDVYDSSKISYGISLGIVYPNKNFDPLQLSPSQDDYPGTVYSGIVVRSNIAYNFSGMRNSGVYLCQQFVSKYVYYNQHTFRDGGDSHVLYTRDEKTVVLGMDLVAGINWAPMLSFDKIEEQIEGTHKSAEKSICFGFWAGLAGRYRIRNTNTYDILNYGGESRDPGRHQKKQFYVFPTTGVKIGFIIKRNKKIDF